MKNPIPSSVARVRKDITSFVFHFVRRQDPLEALRAILKEGYIRGGVYPPGSDSVVCFTEAPLAEVIRQNGILEAHGYDRLSLWGIGFKKDQVFGQGGLPVIYQPRTLYERLPPELRWRHVDFDPGHGIDFTWQREWRVQTEQFALAEVETILVVPDVTAFVKDLWEIRVDAEYEDGELVLYGGAVPKWDFIPIDNVDLSDDRSIEVCRGKDFVELLDDEDYKKMMFE